MRVIVIGGGVVGLCAALELRTEGADVVVLEREQQGRGSSLANAGWVVPAMSTPLAGPGVLGSIARDLRPGAPMTLRPRPDAALVRWCAEFVRHTGADRHLDGVRALVGLGEHSVELYEGLRENGVGFERHRAGLMLVARTGDGLRSAVGLVENSAMAGYSGEYDVLDGDTVRDREPALSGEVAGAVHARAEMHVRSETVIDGLRAKLAEAGVPIRAGIEVDTVTRDGGRLRIATRTGSLTTDRVVVAAGAWSAGLLRTLGVRVPLEPGKGYVITSSGTGSAPVHPMKLVEDNVACTPLDGALRVSGGFGLGDGRWGIPASAVRRILDGASRYLRDWRPGWDATVATGFRPTTPDSLPIIDEVPGHDGVFVATGHGMLGLTLAPATARLLTPLVLRGERGAGLAPFRVDRFGPRVRRTTRDRLSATKYVRSQPTWMPGR